jgi:drug/metabolite transporter (DMT)-like permease
MTATTASLSAENRGLLMGLLGVLIFALTLPMTRLAVGPGEAPQLPPLFVTAGRAAGAALLSVGYLWLTGAPWPTRRDALPLAVSALGTVVGFPLFIALALREVPSMHAAVITGVLPLFTAAVAAWHLRQRPSNGFWVCAVFGCALVLGFAAVQGGGRLVPADGLLLLAMGSAAVGYVAGAQLSARWRAEHVISWVLVISLPLTGPVAWWTQPAAPGGIAAAAWAGFAYVTVFSMWLGFFAWYRGLALGGMVRVSQVQMVQPFLSLLLAVPVLGEPLQVMTLVFAAAVVAVVFIGKRMSVHKEPRA